MGNVLLISDLLQKVIGIQKLYFIEATNSTFTAAKIMLKHKCGALLVCNNLSDKSLLGIITERDLAFRVIPKDLIPRKTKVSQVMTKTVDTIHKNKSIYDAIDMMKKNGYRHLPVIDNKKIIGILSMRDLYAVANNSLVDSIKQHQEFLYGTGYGA